MLIELYIESVEELIKKAFFDQSTQLIDECKQNLLIHQIAELHQQGEEVFSEINTKYFLDLKNEIAKLKNSQVGLSLRRSRSQRSDRNQGRLLESQFKKALEDKNKEKQITAILELSELRTEQHEYLESMRLIVAAEALNKHISSSQSNEGKISSLKSALLPKFLYFQCKNLTKGVLGNQWIKPSFNENILYP